LKAGDTIVNNGMDIGGNAADANDMIDAEALEPESLLTPWHSHQNQLIIICRSNLAEVTEYM